MKDARVATGSIGALALLILLVGPGDAWAIYGQPAVVTAVDRVMAAFLVLLPLYIWVRVRFASPLRRRVSLWLILLNAVGVIGCEAYVFYIHQTVSGFSALGRLELPWGILALLWLVSIPLSVMAICILSAKARSMTALFVAAVVSFCALELTLNYVEIDRYLRAVEESNAQDFTGTDIRNYVCASNVFFLRLYPTERTRAVLLAALASDRWTARHDGALGLGCLRDPSVSSQLVVCLRVEDPDDDFDQARKACAVTLQLLMSDVHGEDAYRVYREIEAEHARDPGALFLRLEREASGS